jgi:exo-beta-1,3-glucanase (GH17 family)
MRTAAVALAASALLMGAEAGSLLRRHAHHKRNYGYEAPAAQDTETCKIVTYTTWVEYNPPKPTYDTTEYVKSTVTVVPTPHSTVPYSYSVAVPTPEVTTCPTPGTYTFPAKTLTLTSTEYVCVPTTAVVTPGVNTYGVHTKVVTETLTTVTCPYATLVTSGTAVYTTLTSTIFECPTPGTYTYGGHTTTATDTCTVTYPTVATYTPGTYTHPLTTVTVTVPQYVYTCPYGAYTPPPPPPPTTTSVKPSPTPAPYVPPVYTSEVKPSPKPETTKAYVPPAPSSTKVATPVPTYGGPIDYSNVGVGRQWGITYTQYNNDKSCKSRDQIFIDIAEVAAKGFRTIRVYAPDCDALEHITDACDKYKLKIVMGVFIRKNGGSYDVQDVYNQVDKLIAWKRWDITELIVIGNESVWGGIISSSDLVALISTCKGKFQGAGYPGKITTSEVVSSLEANPGLCTVIDVVAVNIQPYFNGGHAADAGKFVKQQMEQAKAVCGKETFCLEAGWPSGGAPINNAVAGYDQQAAAIASIYAEDDGHICYFSTYDDLWKDANMNGGVETHFGCAKLFPMGGSSY